MVVWFTINSLGLSPDHSLTTAELINQEGQHGGLLWWAVGLKSLGPEAEGQSSQLCLLTVTMHVDIQDLRHVVPVDPHISKVVPQGGLSLREMCFKNGV